MLQAIRKKRPRAKGAHFAIIASRYNSRYVEAMLRAAHGELKRAGAVSVDVVRVPGAFEIPAVAARLARAGTSQGIPAAIICLGVILRGETTHATHIGEAVTSALMELQVRYEIPMIHEVLLLENEAQAIKRCLSRTHNRGTEAAQTAVAMAKVFRSL
jgi:6,7-dimethyl-8-ribityllumazine synthase